MEIEEIDQRTHLFEGAPHWFSAVLFEGWQFWSAGPDGASRQSVLEQLALYQHIQRAVITCVYVPRIS